MNPAPSLTRYALIGSGRLARHLKFYLHDLGHSLDLWSRDGAPDFNKKPAQDLESAVSTASHILLAVKDQAIPELVSRLSHLGRTLVHFSGVMRVEGAASAHPLMTFGDDLETRDWYRTIPFVIDAGMKMSSLLPGLPNPSLALEPNLRKRYHALCALAGNSTYLLWRKIGDVFEHELKLPRETLGPFLHQVASNAIRAHDTGFTGPVARGDWQVVGSHLEALASEPTFHEAYRTYLRAAQRAGHPVPEVWI